MTNVFIKSTFMVVKNENLSSQRLNMIIKLATYSDMNDVKIITVQTIKTIYPHYYPKGAVEFFINHHSDENIRTDLEDGKIFLCYNDNSIPVGTITINHNEISRLFVLPTYHKKGYGSALLNYAEQVLLSRYKQIILSASFPAKKIYINRGYKVTESHSIEVAYGDFICYDIMMKQ